MMYQEVIIRREPKRNGSGIILFFPDEDYGNTIGYYSFSDGIHGEADIEFYRRCTPTSPGSRTDEEQARIANYAKRNDLVLRIRRRRFSMAVRTSPKAMRHPDGKWSAQAQSGSRKYYGYDSTEKGAIKDLKENMEADK